MENHQAHVLEGKVLFGAYDMGDRGSLLCDTEEDAQAIIDEFHLSLSVTDLLACHQTLRQAGVEAKHAVTIIDRYAQALTLYIDHETYHRLWKSPVYLKYLPVPLTKYIRAYGREIVPGIWMTNGQVTVFFRRGRSFVQHVTCPRTWPLHGEYQSEFLDGLQTAFDDIRTRRVQPLCCVRRSYRTYTALLHDTLNTIFHVLFGGTLTMSREHDDLARICTIYMTQQFRHDLHGLPVAIQQETQHAAHQIAEWPRSTDYRRARMKFFDETIWQIMVTQDYQMVFVWASMRNAKRLYLLRISHHNRIYQNKKD